MSKTSWSDLIDKLAEMYGGQNELARKLNIEKAAMSEYRNGKRSVPNHVIGQIAELTQQDAAVIWLIAKDARNPFGRAERDGFLPILLFGQQKASKRF